MQIGWVHHPHFHLHDPGRGHPECPQRLDAILTAVQRAGLQPLLQPLPFGAASDAQLARVHDPAYVAVVQMLCAEGFQHIGSADTGICVQSHYVAALAAGGVLAAGDAVMSGRLSRAFCAVRPPGHHAETDEAKGFCLYNHAALAADALIHRHGVERVAIVDFDAHHGNGTQHIFAARPDVCYISLHERPESLAFPGTGAATEVGIGPGRGRTLNIPLDRYCRWPEYERLLLQRVVPALDAFGPQALVVSAGFDALAADPVANLSLQAADYEPLTRALVGVAERHAGGRMISVLEGGYDLSQLGAAVVAHLRGLLPAGGADQ